MLAMLSAGPSFFRGITMGTVKMKGREGKEGEREGSAGRSRSVTHQVDSSLPEEEREGGKESEGEDSSLAPRSG